MKRILFMLALIGVAFPACLDNATDIILSEQGTNIIGVIAFTMFLIAGSYALGSALNNPRYTVFAKDEAYHLGFSMVVLVAFSAILVASCSVMDMFYDSTFGEISGTGSSCYESGDGINKVSTCYSKLIEKDAKKISEEYIQRYLDELMDSTFAWSITIPLFNSMTTVPGAYRRVTSNQYDMILNSFLVPALMSISMQKLAINFVNENAMRWILPSAFLLRIFIPTRSIGNILIALALGLYVVIPFMFVFNYTMYEAVLTDCTSFAAAVCDNVVDGVCTNPTAACTNYYGFWNVARLIPQAFFLPNLTIAVFITFLASMNKALRVLG